MERNKNKMIATEILREDSTEEDFISELANHVATFIKDNRVAFSTDDAEAIDEYLSASSIELVRARALEVLGIQDTYEDEQVYQEDTEEDGQEPQVDSEIADSDLVPDDVMNLLDRD